ncbi:hypothetical protein [Desulfosporosinus sp. BICA1-9]|uniref:hypothetical protein n=1 Tax=Desulfosporosinus sp. BICA1-9 TaxID=1531958 RepID=UPI00054BA982|nr:hypothetical protein [Desulfosporosinus sp. BICA1-9]KJS47083.1 MAG: hypothetical protein VR66_21680 [Peptococcaceae bacterium BRH_c23]KJS90434.1 MAG: hypothetical protein JL57_01985 [Desulfosporosinus sp. BICA1-9]HBW38616.1 hypothetical protein [Desulfosporosinus sp.]
MPTKLSKALWSLAILFIVVTTVVFSFGIMLVGAALASLYGIYKYYFGKKRSSKFKQRPQEYMFGEVIDIKAEVIDQTLLDKAPYRN